MEIFSFDMMLDEVTAARGIGPTFLVHDSHIFDGVDQRQRAMALAVGKRVAARTGRQYITTMNSDEFPNALDRAEGLDLAEDILPVQLDDSPEGGLFGMRFD